MTLIKFSQEQLELIKVFKKDWNFVAGADNYEQLPKFLYDSEIAFVGKSNVGKSSLINALTGRKALARVSHTPGRTKQINFFNVKGELTLVDLPGYGYAKVSKKVHKTWEQLILTYLKQSINLKICCLLIDSRRGIKEHDLAILELLTSFDKRIFIIFTKADKISNEDTIQLTSTTSLLIKPYLEYIEETLYISSRRNDDTQRLRLSLGTYIKYK